MQIIIRLPAEITVRPETLIAESQVPGLSADRIVRGVFRESRIPATIARIRDVEQLISLAIDGAIDPAHSHQIATPFSDGLLSAEDKQKLDELSPGSLIESINDVPGLEAALNSKADLTTVDGLSESYSILAVDQITNTANIAAVATALDGKAPINHSHPVDQITGLISTLNSLQNQISTLQSSSSAGAAQLLTYSISQSSVDSGLIGTYNNLTDGVFTTGAATGSTSPSWIRADLGSEKLVWRVSLAGGNLGSGWAAVASYLNSSALEVSLDNVIWTPITTIADVTDSSSALFSIPQTRARYIRLKRNGYLATSEFKIYGNP